MNCSNCNKPIKSGWSICPYCGNHLAKKVICSYCGKEIETKWKNCPFCGNEINLINPKKDITIDIGSDSVAKFNQHIDSNNVTNVYNLPKSNYGSITGETCNVCGRLLKDDWIKCNECERNVCKKCFVEDSLQCRSCVLEYQNGKKLLESGDIESIEKFTCQLARELVDDFIGDRLILNPGTLTVEQARIISGVIADELKIGSELTLTSDTARELAEFCGDSLILHDCFEIADETLSAFAGFLGNSITLGLLILSDSQSKILSEFNTKALVFSKLTEINEVQARNLSNFKGNRLIFRGLVILTRIEKALLERFDGEISYPNKLIVEEKTYDSND